MAAKVVWLCRLSIYSRTGSDPVVEKKVYKNIFKEQQLEINLLKKELKRYQDRDIDWRPFVCENCGMEINE